MLTIIQLVINGFLAFVLFPLIVFQLLAGSPPSRSGPFRKYQLAVPRLDLTGNLFVLALCLIAMTQLARHFGLLDAALAGTLDAWLQVPFLILFFAYVALWITALLRVHRGRASE